MPMTEVASITNATLWIIHTIYYKESYKEILKDYCFMPRKLQGDNSCQAKLSTIQVKEIINHLLNEEFIPDIANLFNVNTNMIWDIKLHKTWKHLTKGIKFPNVNKRNAKGIRGKEVTQYDLNRNYIATYISAREAERATGISYKYISRVCKGERPHTMGYIFKFA